MAQDSTNIKDLLAADIEKNLHSANADDDFLILPIDGLSRQMQRIICAVTDCYQCSRDIVVSATFQVVAAAIGKKITVKDSKFANLLMLWICHIAPSGSNKSAPVKLIVKPLMLADRKAYKDYKLQHDVWKLNGGADSGDAEPVYHQHLLNDSTPEARNKALVDNVNGIMIYRDEMKGELDDIGRYNKSGEISQRLSSFDGNDITINRKSEAPILIESPFISYLGGIQPSVVGDAFGKEQLMGNGFNARWLFVYPQNMKPVMYAENYISKEITDAWNSYISELCARDFSAIDNELIITGQAKQVYVDYYNELQLKKAESDDYMAAVYSKLQIIVIRWAGIAHVMAGRENEKNIRQDTMEYAVKCMRYFEGTAERVYSLLQNRSVPQVAAPTKEQIMAYICNSFNIKSKQAVADAIGQERSAVSRAANKYPMLRVTCYGGANADKQGVSDEKQRNTQNDDAK
jgi:hypothetical protein